MARSRRQDWRFINAPVLPAAYRAWGALARRLGFRPASLARPTLAAALAAYQAAEARFSSAAVADAIRRGEFELDFRFTTPFPITPRLVDQVVDQGAAILPASQEPA